MSEELSDVQKEHEHWALPEEEATAEEIKSFPFDGVIVFGHGWSKKGWHLSWEAKARAIAGYQM